MWGALSDEIRRLPLTIAASPRQRSHSRVRVLRHSRPYFTVSDLRLPNLEGQVPVVITTSNRVDQLYPRHFRRLLRLAGLRRRYSHPPPHGFYIHCPVAPIVFKITSRHGLRRKDSIYCWSVFIAPSHSNGRSAEHIENTTSLLLRRVCRRKIFTEPLLRNGLHNRDLFFVRVCCRRCTATVAVYKVTS
jgi:hypothetical protein